MPLLKKVARNDRCPQPAIPGEQERVEILVREVLGQSYPNREQVAESFEKESEECFITYECASGLPRAVVIVNLETGAVLHLAAISAEERDELLDYARRRVAPLGIEDLHCPEDIYKASVK